MSTYVLFLLFHIFNLFGISIRTSMVGSFGWRSKSVPHFIALHVFKFINCHIYSLINIKEVIGWNPSIGNHIIHCQRDNQYDYLERHHGQCRLLSILMTPYKTIITYTTFLSGNNQPSATSYWISYIFQLHQKLF